MPHWRAPREGDSALRAAQAGSDITPIEPIPVIPKFLTLPKASDCFSAWIGFGHSGRLISAFGTPHRLSVLFERFQWRLVTRVLGLPQHAIMWPFAPDEVEALSPFAVETRYPDDSDPLSENEVTEAISLAVSSLRRF